MNLDASYIKVAGHVDNALGIFFNKINKKIRISKVPTKLAQRLTSETGIDMRKKCPKREVIEAINNNIQTKIDNAFAIGTKITTADPATDMADCISDFGEYLGRNKIIKNTSLAKAADNARTSLDVRYENLSQNARDVINKYMKNPINVLKLYIT